MQYNPDLHHRQSLRLRDYDYSQNGYYFVTICVYNRQNLFGCVDNGKMILNESGEMIKRIWKQIPSKYYGIQIDEFIIMPNHIHGIIIINHNVGAGPCACPDMLYHEVIGRPQGAAPTWRLSLSDIIHRYKSFTTKGYIDGVRKYHWPSFNLRLWQRSFYDHVIRDEISLNKIREYIINNPAQWDIDKENQDLVSHFVIPKSSLHLG